MKRAFLPLIAALLVAAGQIALYYERLPESVASHFGAGGEANGWMAKGTFVGFYLGLIVFLGVVLGGSSVLVARAPDSMINLPHKSYWLAPERRAETMRTMRATLDTIYWGTMAFMVLLMQGVFRANLEGETARLDGTTTWFILGYLAAVFWLTGRLCFRFWRVPRSDASQRSQT